MCQITLVDSALPKQLQVRPEAPIQLSSEEARQGDLARNTLHVLGFGLVGAILANALVFAFFTFS
jgi:hypothetical protein